MIRRQSMRSQRRSSSLRVRADGILPVIKPSRLAPRNVPTKRIREKKSLVRQSPTGQLEGRVLSPAYFFIVSFFAVPSFFIIMLSLAMESFFVSWAAAAPAATMQAHIKAVARVFMRVSKYVNR